MSAHSAPHSGGWLSALVAQVSDWVFEEVEELVEPQPQELKPHPVVAVVAAAPRSGASTIARLLAAEMAGRADGAAVVVAADPSRRSAPPTRAAIRLATALTGVAAAQPVGRLCIVRRGDHDGRPGGNRVETAAGADRVAAAAEGRVAAAARYLAPVVLDLPADGSAAGIAAVADRVVVVGAPPAEPALLDAVAVVIGGGSIKLANRVTDPDDWAHRADFVVADSRIGARAAALGTRAPGSLGAAISSLADALEAAR